MQNNNLVTEISMLILAILLIVAGSLLLYVGKISYDAAIFFFISALGLFGFNGALKAPSPAQQSQLTVQQTQIAAAQELALNVANTQQSLLAQAHTHAEPVAAQAVPPLQPPSPGISTATTQFIDYGRHWGDSQVMPVVPPQ